MLWGLNDNGPRLLNGLPGTLEDDPEELEGHLELR
jgi:hypothetical protein